MLSSLISCVDGISVWPFDKTESSEVVIVEAYPSAFYVMASCKRPNPGKQTQQEVETIVDKTLRRFNVTCGRHRPHLQDEIDAYVTSAALANLSTDDSNFFTPDQLRTVIAQEGWIFGVPFGGSV